MKIKLRAFYFFFFSCLISGAAAVVPPVEKLLPEDTLLVVTMPDYAKMREIYKISPQSQLWNDPAMKPFKDKFLSKLHEELIQPLERDLSIRFDDYTNLPQGQVTFAITRNNWPSKPGQPPGMLFLMDTRNKNNQLRKNLADLRKKCVEAGKTLKTEKIRNIEFSVLSISDKDLPKTLRKLSSSGGDGFGESETNSPKTELFIGQSDSLLIVGNSSAPIEKVLVHLTGGAMPALGDSAAYEANRLALFRDAPFYGWVNAAALVDMLTRKSQVAEDSQTPDPFSAFNPNKIMTALGVGGLKTIALSVQNSSEGSLVQISAGIPESSRQGIFKIFTGEAKDSGPPAFVPANAVKFQRWRIDGQKAWATIQKTMNDISPQWSGGINFMLETANAAAKEKDPDFDIKKNLFGNLGDDMIHFQKAPRGNTLTELASPPSLFLLGSPNPDQLASALKSVLVFLNSRGGTPTEREFLGRKIYSMPLPPAPGASAARSLNYVSSGGYVALSTDASMIEEYLRSSEGEQKKLRETPGLNDAIAKVGGSSTGWLGFENQSETTRSVFEALRKNSAATSASPGLIPGVAGLPGGDNNFKNWMDFSLLPPFDSVAKYFNFTVFAVGANVDGLTFKMFAPTPSKLRK